MAKVTVELNDQGQLRVERDPGMPHMFALGLLDLGAEILRREIIPIPAGGGRIEVPAIQVPGPLTGRN